MNRFSVLPRVCNTDFTQIAIARGSLSFRFTAFSVRFTFLIQEQKRVAEAFFVFFRICEGILLGLRNF